MLANAFDKRTVAAIAALAVVAGLAWFTMSDDKIRLVTLVLLGFFGFRIVLTAMRRAAEREQEQEKRE